LVAMVVQLIFAVLFSIRAYALEPSLDHYQNLGELEPALKSRFVQATDIETLFLKLNLLLPNSSRYRCLPSGVDSFTRVSGEGDASGQTCSGQSCKVTLPATSNFELSFQLCPQASLVTIKQKVCNAAIKQALLGLQNILKGTPLNSFVNKVGVIVSQAGFDLNTGCFKGPAQRIPLDVKNPATAGYWHVKQTITSGWLADSVVSLKSTFPNTGAFRTEISAYIAIYDSSKSVSANVTLLKATVVWGKEWNFIINSKYNPPAIKWGGVAGILGGLFD